MWVYLPSNTCRSAPETEDSISASVWRSKLLSAAATWKTKRLPSKSWLNAWKRDRLIQRLFGRIYEPSTASLGAEKFRASLEDTLVSHGLLRAKDLVKKIRVTSGPPSPESSGKSNLPIVFSKTSRVIFPLDSLKCEPSYEQWASELKRDCSLRLKWGVRIFEKDSSFLPPMKGFWPTPLGKLGGANSKRSSRNAGGPDLQERVKFWPSPRVCEGLRTSGCNRTEYYRIWDKIIKAMQTQESPSFHPNRMKSKNGKDFFSKSRSLNPLFVSWLMNQPIGWSNPLKSVESANYDCWETASSQRVRQLLFLYSSFGLI